MRRGPLPGCFGKQPYNSFNHAERFARVMRRRWKSAFVSYKCRFCPHWHIGEKP
jgi:hypothetical protein